MHIIENVHWHKLSIDCAETDTLFSFNTRPMINVGAYAWFGLSITFLSGNFFLFSLYRIKNSEETDDRSQSLSTNKWIFFSSLQLHCLSSSITITKNQYWRWLWSLITKCWSIFCWLLCVKQKVNSFFLPFVRSSCIGNKRIDSLCSLIMFISSS
jgi:hypothetical protein